MPVVTLVHKITAHFEVPEGMTHKELEEALAQLRCPEDVQDLASKVIELARQDVEYAYSGVRNRLKPIKVLSSFTSHNVHEGYKEP